MSKEEVATKKEATKVKFKGKTIHKNIKCNTWYTRYRVNGKQYYISAKTQFECMQKLKQALNNLPIQQKQNNDFNNNKVITFIEWYNQWLELYKIGKVKNDTLVDYKTLLKKIPHNIQNKDITKISIVEILKSLNDCEGERQRQKLYDFYNMIFKKAEDNDIIPKNFMVKIDKPKHDKNHGQALNNEQQKILIETCNNVDNSDFILIALYQGLRRGEVLGLTRDNINFDKNTLTINKAWNSKNQFDTTKNKQSNRIMPLFEQSKGILLKYKDKSNRIFDISIKQCELIVKAIKTKSKISNLKLKDMRSTFITRCDELGIPERVYQSWCGHKPGSKVTKTTYLKHNIDVDANYINIINKSDFITKKE